MGMSREELRRIIGKQKPASVIAEPGLSEASIPTAAPGEQG